MSPRLAPGTVNASLASLDRSRRTAILLVGDLIAIGVFVGAGEIRHGRSVLEGGLTYLDFVFGWLLVGFLVGAFAGSAISSRGWAVLLASVGWMLGAGVGQLIRALREPGFFIAPSFLVVSIAVGGVLLVGWRLLALEWFRRRS